MKLTIINALFIFLCIVLSKSKHRINKNSTQTQNFSNNSANNSLKPNNPSQLKRSKYHNQSLGHTSNQTNQSTPKKKNLSRHGDQHQKKNNTNLPKINGRNRTLISKNPKSRRMKRESDKQFRKYMSLFITAPKNKSTGFLHFQLRRSNRTLSLGILKNRFTIVSNNSTFLENSHEATILAGNHILINSINAEGSFKYRNVSQWRLISEDNFQDPSLFESNWNFNKTTTCKHLNFLGGHCKLARQNLTYEIEDLANHTEVRIEANFHFIGNWNSNTAALEVYRKRKTNKFLWTGSCKNPEKKGMFSGVCGYDVCKLNSLINVSFPHKNSYLKLTFSNDFTHNHPCQTSYAISNFKVYIR